MNKFLFLIFSLTYIPAFASIIISKAPITFAYDPTSRSAKTHTTKSPDILYAGERPRYSACSGVVWLPDDRFLLSVHLFGATISTYEFDRSTHAFIPIRCMGNDDGFSLNHPENLEISPDGIWLAMSQGGGTTDLFLIDIDNNLVYPTGISLCCSDKDWTHGVAFSNNQTFLASTSIGDSSCICIYKFTNGSFEMHQVLENQIRPLEPKGVAFSPDNRFLAACYCQTIGTNKTCHPEAQLEIYCFDPVTQLFDPNPVSVFRKTPGNMETIKFSKDGSYLLSTDQVLDEVYLHRFDLSTGMLLDSEVLLDNPTAELNFPHGLAFSNDGKYLAVTNYGDDRITIYEITNGSF